MERFLKNCGYKITISQEEKLPVSGTASVVEAEISCSNCKFFTRRRGSGTDLNNAKSQAIVEASMDRKKFCPVLNPDSSLTFAPGEKRAPEYSSPTPHIEQNPQPRGWIVLS